MHADLLMPIRDRPRVPQASDLKRSWQEGLIVMGRRPLYAKARGSWRLGEPSGQLAG